MIFQKIRLHIQEKTAQTPVKNNSKAILELKDQMDELERRIDEIED